MTVSRQLWQVALPVRVPFLGEFSVLPRGGSSVKTGAFWPAHPVIARSIASLKPLSLFTVSMSTAVISARLRVPGFTRDVQVEPTREIVLRPDMIDDEQRIAAQ